MPYALEIAEPIPLAVARIMGEQLDRIGQHLADSEVHETRKRLKEIRALLRLVRRPLGEAFAVENVWYRDAGREFADARDAEVVRSAAEKLMESAEGDARNELAAVTKSLGRRRIAKRALQGRIDNLAAQLPAARDRMAPEIEDRFATIGDGLERTLRAGCAALDDRSAEGLHELRKRVKDHWYHIQLLRRLWPEMMKGHAAAVEELSDALGDHHDLIVLEAALGNAAPRSILAARRAELEQAALSTARLVFSEPPAALRKRIRGYWRATR